MKKKIPLSLIEALKPLTDKYLDILEPIFKSEIIYGVKDKDTSSDFFFHITKQDSDKGQILYTISFKPRNKNQTAPFSARRNLKSLAGEYEQWLRNIDQYNKTKTIYDDPIIESYSKDFESKFEIIDENSDIEPFNLEQQILIDNYLEQAQEKVLYLKKIEQEENKKNHLDELLEEINKVKSAVPKESKKQVIRKLSLFWAKAQKIGLNVLKEVFINLITEGIKKTLLGN
ncbi:MAG: hypothetical protein ABJK11_11820 [Balneola sp.]